MNAYAKRGEAGPAPRGERSGGERRAEVLIVGAGPAGLTLACDLARRGVAARLVEQAQQLFPGSRGKGIQPRSQEVFDDLGVLEAMRAAGGAYPLMAGWEGGERLGTWDMLERTPATPGTPYTEPLMLPQWRTQEILAARLKELGGEIEFGRRLTGFAQDPEGVTAEVTDPAGATRTIRAAYLVGTDGGRGAVRRAAGIGMTGAALEPGCSLVADVRVDGLDRDFWHVWPKGEGGVLVMCPLSGTEDFQLVARFDEGAEPDTSPEAIRSLVAARTHLGAGQVTGVGWASVHRPRAAMADRFRDGRVFLAGDAAHIHSPAGGQGLNTSIQDAYNLGWKLGRVLRHGAPDALLDTYEEERLPVAAGVLGISTRLHRSANEAEQTWTTRRGAETQQLGIGYRDSTLSADTREALPPEALRAGDRAPQAGAVTSGGEEVRLFDAFRGPHFTLLAIGAEPPAVADDQVRVLRLDGEEVRDAYGTGYFLIRPDGHVGLACADPAAVADYLGRLQG